jgi:RNA-binding protein Luc7-like 2
MDAKALLDELMGKERNVPLSERSQRRMRYDDPSVCKYDMAGLCPHGLFKNTRSDLGPCSYEIHSDHIDWSQFMADYDKQDDREKERYEKRLMRYLEDLIREMDRKIVKSKDRAEKESQPKPVKPEDQVKLDELHQRAKEALEKSQVLGEEGDVDQALMLSQQADAYKKQHEEMYKRLTTPDRIMTVCEICGVFINSTDNEARRLGGRIPQPILDHLNGKQYLGWKAIREQYAKLQEKYASHPKAPSAPRDEEPAPKERERERSPRLEERPRSVDRYGSRGGDRRGDDRYAREDRGREDSYRGGSRGGDYYSGRDGGYPSRGGSYGGGRERDRYYEERRR